MPGRLSLPKQNEYEDNGWWKLTDDNMAHYFTKKIPLCGTGKFSKKYVHLKPKTCYDLRCKNCSKVRRNQLRARMNMSYFERDLARHNLLTEKEYSAGKPQ